MKYTVIGNSISTSDYSTDWGTIRVALDLLRGYVPGRTVAKKKNGRKMNIIISWKSLRSQWFAFHSPFKVDVSNTFFITPWCRVLLEKLTGLQLVKKFPAFCGTRRLITALTSVRHLSLSWASPIQSIYPHPTSWRSILILSTHLRLGLPITYLLTPWCRVLLEKLIGFQLVKKFPTFHGTRRFITALTSVRHLSLSWASPIQSIYLHPTSWRSILILSTHLRLSLPITYLLTYLLHGAESFLRS